MDVSIKYSDFIAACSKPLDKNGNEATNGLFDYTAKLCTEIFGQETLQSFSEYKINPYGAVFSGKNTITELTEKRFGKRSHSVFSGLERCVLISEIIRGKLIFFCSIKHEKSGVGLADAERMHFTLTDVVGKDGRKLKKKVEKNNGKLIPEKKMQVFKLLAKKKLVNIRLRLLVDVMKASQNDRRFIARFNEEIFFKNVKIGSRKLTSSDVFLFFGGEGANQYLNLKQKPVQIAITALYTIATRGLTLSDIYSVSTIFPTEEGAWRIRGKDNLKIEAASEFIAIIQSADFDAIIDAFSKMGRAMLELELPRIDLAETKLLADSYTLYAGISNIGAAFITATKNQSITLRMLEKSLGSDFKKVMSSAQVFTEYEKIVALCNIVSTLDTGSSMEITGLDGYLDAAAFQNRIGYGTKMSEIKFQE